MPPTEHVVDLAHYRKRKQAQQAGRLMWALYAQQAGVAAQQWAQAARQAREHRQA